MPERWELPLHVTAPADVPEIRLALAAAEVGLWDATDDEYRHNQPPPFWAFAWPGGVALARHLLDNPQLVRGQRVVDLGTGSGLVAIAARLAGAEAVLAVDTDPDAVAAVTRNADANHVAVDTLATDLLDIDGRGADVVAGFQASVLTAGDVFYSAGHADRAMRFLRRVQAVVPSIDILVGDPHRGFLTPRRFESLEERQIRTSRALEDVDSMTATVWRLGAPALKGRQRAEPAAL